MDSLVRTARATGLWYLGLFVTGMLGFLVVRPRLFAEGDPTGTLSNLAAQETLARFGILLELGIAVTQVLVALWFFRLFRSVDRFAAGTVAVFGIINGVAILASAALLATALEVALGAAPGGDTASQVQLLYVLSGNLWDTAAVFFGLWLIPMGLLAHRSGWMPRALGWTLVVGGVGWVLSAVSVHLLPDADRVAEALQIPAIVGEFWILGYLLIVGVRRRDHVEADAAA